MGEKLHNFENYHFQSNAFLTKFYFKISILTIISILMIVKI